MSDTWVKENCSRCGTVNWIGLGDMSDITGIDIEGYKCYKCQEITYLFDDEQLKWDQQCGQWESLEDCYWEPGKEKPN